MMNFWIVEMAEAPVEGTIKENGKNIPEVM